MDVKALDLTMNKEFGLRNPTVTDDDSRDISSFCISNPGIYKKPILHSRKSS